MSVVAVTPSSRPDGPARTRSAPDYPFSASPVVLTTPIRPGWKWHRLTDLARLATGHTPSRRHAEYWNGDIPWLQLPDIRALDGRRAMGTLEHTNELGIANSAAVLLPENTVCMSRTASVGFVTLMGRPMATSQDFVNWVCGPNLYPEFLMHLLIACRAPIRELGSGAVHHTIYFPTVKAFSVCVPPRAEQERIATWLTAAMAEAEQARAAARARLAAATALPASFVRQLFESPGAREWPLSPLRELLEENGQYGTSVRSNKDERGIAVLGMPHIRPGRIRWENVAHADLSAEEVVKYRLKSGDILFNRTNSAELVGKTAIFDGFRDACFASYLIRFRARRDRVEPAFICAYINSGPGRAFVERHMARAVGQVNISASTMHRMPIPCPSLEVQREILEAVDSRTIETNTIVELCHHELAGIDALPAALLREAFGSTEDDDGEAV